MRLSAGIGRLQRNRPTNGFVNVFALLVMFTSGMSFPVDMMPDPMITIGKLLPGWWFCTSIDQVFGIGTAASTGVNIGLWHHPLAWATVRSDFYLSWPHFWTHPTHKANRSASPLPHNSPNNIGDHIRLQHCADHVPRRPTAKTRLSAHASAVGRWRNMHISLKHSRKKRRT